MHQLSGETNRVNTNIKHNTKASKNPHPRLTPSTPAPEECLSLFALNFCILSNCICLAIDALRHPPSSSIHVSKFPHCVWMDQKKRRGMIQLKCLQLRFKILYPIPGYLYIHIQHTKGSFDNAGKWWFENTLQFKYKCVQTLKTLKRENRDLKQKKEK